METRETIVIGGGPSGSSTAAELVKAGRDVLILDRKEFPRLKLCAGWITPKVVRDIDLNLKDYPHRILEVRKMRIHSSLFSYNLPVTQYSISRIEFDAWLLNRSAAEVRNENVKEIERDGEEFIINGKYRAKYLVGAGGTADPVARLFFPGERNKRLHISTRELEFDTEVRSNDFHLWFPRGFSGYAWFVPKAKGRVNVGVGGFSEKNKDLNAWWEWTVNAVKKLNLIDEVPGRPGAHSYYVNSGKFHAREGNAFLVGDALGLATIDLAEGIGPAIESGQMVARTIIDGSPYTPEKIKRSSLPFSWMRHIPLLPAM